MQTQRLTLRRFRPEDWKDLYEYLSDENVVMFEPYGVYTEEECRIEAERRSKSDIFWAVCLKDTTKVIGNVTLSPEPFDAWSVGYVFSAAYQRQGYATEAAKAVVSHAFAQGARRVIAQCNSSNDASWRLLERIGMRKEAHFVKSMYFKKDGRGQPIWFDEMIYAILREEWENSEA